MTLMRRNIHIWIFLRFFYVLKLEIQRDIINKIPNYGKKGDGVMDMNDLKKMKKDSGMTNAEIAELSGIPLSTVNKIFSTR